MEDDVGQGPSFAQRTGDMFERLEGIYLRILRAIILLLATILIIYAAGLTVVSLFKISRSASSVVEEVATVNGQDLLSAEGAEIRRPTTSTQGVQTNPAHRQFYQGFVRRYHSLFRSRFEPFRQREDRQLSLDAFDDAYVNTEARLEGIRTGRTSFESDRADLELLLTTMTEAAQAPETQRRLQAYRSARKVRICRDEQRSRTVYRPGWDRYSMACPEWYYPPYGCPARRAVQQPYTERVCEMRFPEGTRSHADIFRAYHDQFFRLLQERREANTASAAMERENILVGNVEGWLSLKWSGWILVGFLAVMFFFLLIAIERHQRRLAEKVEGLGGPPPDTV